jgi:hypothetical protein
VIRFAIDVEIARPPTDVFAYITDPAKLGTWQTNTVSAVPEGEGPIGVGTRLREVHRGPGGRELESLVEVSEFEHGRTFAVRGHPPVEATRIACRTLTLGADDAAWLPLRVVSSRQRRDDLGSPRSSRARAR